MNSLNKILGLIVVILVLSSQMLAEKSLSIDSDEKVIRKEKLKKLNKDNFQNRSNDKADVEARKLDIETGKKLSSLILSDPKKSHLYKSVTVRRFVSNENGKFSGDVLELGNEANFGHINSIVRVVTGYVNNTYGYSQEDSELLALYSVYYNLKHRNNLSYVASNFGKSHATILKKEKLGIAEKFQGWNGMTQILIPIEANVLKNGGLDLATYELEDQVNPDIDAQKGGSESKKKFASMQNKKIKSEKDELQAKYDANQKKEKELTSKKKAIEDKLAVLMKDPVKNKAEIAKLTLEKAKLDSELEKVALEKKELESKMEQVASREEMRRLGFTSEKEYAEFVLGKKKAEETKKTETVTNTETKTETKKVETTETVTTKVQKEFLQSFHTKQGTIVQGRESIYVPGTGIITIGYALPRTETSELLLFLIGSGEFEILSNSEGIKVYSESPLIINEGEIYIFEQLKDKIYLTRLTPKLELDFRSSEPIDPESDLVFGMETIQVVKRNRTGSSNDVIYFRKKDLTQSK
ncbi:MAG: P83/100 family protein [Leptospiraceae bacterium]|nr:P83/100 family protein [Leptospiraceae bacterium]